MVKHHKNLFIKDFINANLFSRVFLDGVAIINVMKILTLKKFAKKNGGSDSKYYEDGKFREQHPTNMES